MWKLVGDAAAEGRLLVDLAEVELSLSTKLSLLAPGIPPILPDSLPSELMPVESDTSFPQETETEDLALDPQSGITGLTFDASVLATTEEQAHFHRNLAAVTAVLAGMGISGAARAYGMATSTLSRLVHRTKEFGQIACVPYATYHRDRVLHPDLQHLIRKLYNQPFRPTVMAISEDAQLKQRAEELTERENKPIPAPRYHQV